jgi:hypothetical protein
MGSSFYSVIVIAATGQLSAASRQAGSSGGGTGVAMTSATDSFMANTAGQIVAQSPHPIQVSLSTFAFISVFFLLALA